MKYCPECKKNKPYYDFHKDRSRPDGLKWLCIECAKAKRSKKDIVSAMPEAEFMKLLENKELHKFINTEAKRYFKVDEDSRDYARQAAWARISLYPTIENVEELKKAAHREIYWLYRQRYELRKHEEYQPGGDVTTLQSMQHGKTKTPMSDNIDATDKGSNLSQALRKEKIW